MTSSEQRFKQERVQNLRQRLGFTKEDVSPEKYTYQHAELLQELIELEKELAEEHARSAMQKHRRTMAFFIGMFGAVVVVSVLSLVFRIYAPQYVRIMDWLMVAAQVFYATIGATNAIKQFKKGPYWRKLAWMNTGLFVWAMVFAVWTLF